ncbi:hypothetical protein CspeluHIS016_0503120 [Cutaneotrichosporon spelunceum]|uniref:Uncharacterized protein n=1 Tax=Cutaneotrichosporon spelunceum TaxID=1672016 RepID=A0AAD3YCM5_9TREE|nr:hypothetical protein CspeluHIS016_0503120 [Cutaneotrichosporon spelunceum]
MKLGARKLVERMRRREEEPPPPYSPLDPQAARRRTPSASGPRSPQPTPAYSPPVSNSGPASFNTLPIALVHRVLMLAADPVATPDAWEWDLETERVRRLHWLFLSLRAVNRRLYLVATSILRDRLLPTYTSLLQFPSSSPLPPPGTDSTDQPIFAARSREAAVLDRFVAMRLGEDLRRLESTLYEDSGEEDVLFSHLQPAARIEDLLIHLPRRLVAPPDEPVGEVRQALPLAHTHIAVTLSPLWAQLWFSYSPVNATNTRGARVGRSLVVEVRREKDPESMVRTFGQALEWLRTGQIGWGWSFRSSST